MTTAALFTMIASWTIIAFFTLRFFLKVLKTPQEKDEPPTQH